MKCLTNMRTVGSLEEANGFPEFAIKFCKALGASIIPDEEKKSEPKRLLDP